MTKNKKRIQNCSGYVSAVVVIVLDLKEHIEQEISIKRDLFQSMKGFYSNT